MRRNCLWKYIETKFSPFMKRLDKERKDKELYYKSLRMYRSVDRNNLERMQYSSSIKQLEWDRIIDESIVDSSL